METKEPAEKAPLLPPENEEPHPIEEENELWREAFGTNKQEKGATGSK